MFSIRRDGLEPDADREFIRFVNWDMGVLF